MAKQFDDIYFKFEFGTVRNDIHLVDLKSFRKMSRWLLNPFRYSRERVFQSSQKLVQSPCRVCRNVGNDDAVRAGLRSDVGAGAQLGRGAALRAGRENRCPSVDGAAQPRSWGAQLVKYGLECSVF